MPSKDWIDVRDLIPQIMANYAAGRAPQDQREKDAQAFADWEAQPDPVDDDEQEPA
jgi:hypothetical protein